VPARPDRIGLGIATIVAAVAAMSFQDGMVKYVSAGMPLWQIYGPALAARPADPARPAAPPPPAAAVPAILSRLGLPAQPAAGDLLYRLLRQPAAAQPVGRRCSRLHGAALHHAVVGAVAARPGRALAMGGDRHRLFPAC